MNIACKSGGRYHLLVDVGRPVSRVRKGLAHIVSMNLVLSCQECVFLYFENKEATYTIILDSCRWIIWWSPRVRLR